MSLRAVAGPSALISDGTIDALETLELEPLATRGGRAPRRRSGRQGGGADRGRACGAHPSGGQRQSSGAELLTKEWVAHGSSLAARRPGGTEHAAGREISHPARDRRRVRRQIRRLDSPLRRNTRPSCRAREAARGPFRSTRLWTLPLRRGRSPLPLEGRGFLREVHGGLEFRKQLIRAQAYYSSWGRHGKQLHRR